jgi:hypothetical protein
MGALFSSPSSPPPVIIPPAPSPPAPQPLPAVPKEDNAAVQEAAAKERRAAAQAKGLGSTLLTSGLGLTTTPEIEKKKLLGNVQPLKRLLGS